MIRPNIADRDATRHILKAFHLHASKRLGQNFLISRDVVRAVVEAADISPGDKVLEIGPGIGTLTQGLLEAGAIVTAVELDKKLPEVLSHTLSGYENIRVVQGDILKTDITELMGDAPFKIAANLPYYITTPILMTLLERRLPVTRIVTMVQKEVALRMVAKPGGKDYGSLSVAVQYYTRPSIVMEVSPESFLPPPEVNSAVIVCEALAEPAVSVTDEALFFRVVRAAFGQRRKTVLNALSSVGISKDSISRSLAASGIDPKRRGETLSLCEFAKLSNSISTSNIV